MRFGELVGEGGRQAGRGSGGKGRGVANLTKVPAVPRPLKLGFGEFLGVEVW